MHATHLCPQAQLPTSYFLMCLGKHLKYSSCLWPTQEATLDEAEEAMLGAPPVCPPLRTHPTQRPLQTLLRCNRHTNTFACSLLLRMRRGHRCAVCRLWLPGRSGEVYDASIHMPCRAIL